MKQIILRDEKWGKNEHHILKALINDNDDLVFEGIDMGDSVKERYGDFDFEYWYKIDEKDVSKLLLNLLKEKFNKIKISEILKWLKQNKIPYTSTSF